MKAFETSKALIIVVGLLVLVASLNVIVRRGGPMRWDTTSGDVYTLAEGTRNILKKVKASKRPVTIRFYLSDEEDVQLPKNLVEYSKRVKDLLAEYAEASSDAVVVQTYSPVPNSVEEDAAELDGIMRRDPRADLPPTESFDDYDFNRRGRAREPYYFGLSISSLENIEIIPFLDPKQEADLEYQLSRAVSAVIRKKKLKIGLLEGSDMQMAGSGGMMGQRPSPPWTIYNYLQRDFEIVSVPFDVKPIEPGDEEHPFYDIDLLIIVHPVKVNRPQPTQPGMPAIGTTTLEPLSTESQYAIDQYLVNGGKAIAFLDNQYFVSRFFDVYSTTLPFALDDRHPQWYKDLVNLFDSQGWSNYRSGLDKLYPSWGVKLGSSGSGDPVIYDPKYTRAVSYDRPVNAMVQREFRLVSQLRQIPNEGVYQQIVSALGRGRALMSDFGKDSLTEEHPVTRGLSSVRMVDPAPIEGKPAAGLEMRTLVRSSGKSKAIPGEAAGLILDRSRTLDQAMANLQAADVKARHHPVAVILEGKFKSAFDSNPTKVAEEDEAATPPQPLAPPKPPTPRVSPPLLPPGAPDSLPEPEIGTEGSDDPVSNPPGEAQPAPETTPSDDSEPPSAESQPSEGTPEGAPNTPPNSDSPGAPAEDAPDDDSGSGEPPEGEFPNPQNPAEGEGADEPESETETKPANGEETETPAPAEAEEGTPTSPPGEAKPAPEPKDEPKPAETDKPAGTDKPEEKEEPAEVEEPDHHKQLGTEPGTLALISDVDMLFDFFLGNPEAGARRDHDNIAFVLNLVETMAGDEDLVNIRGRDSTSRGFTVINDIREKAAERAAEPRKKIRKKLEEIEKQTMDGKLVLTQEGIQYQIDEAKAKKIRQLERESRELKRDENKIDREQRREVEAAINRYEWINMLLTPLIVIVLGLAVAFFRKFKTAAK